MSDNGNTPGFVFVRVQDITLWERNYNEGDVGAISNSIAAFGYNRTIALWQDMVARAGNHTAQALQWLEKQQAELPKNVHLVDDEWWIYVTDISHLSDEQATAYAIADNRTAALANPDTEQLATLLQEIANYDDALFAASGFDGDSLDEMLRELNLPDVALPDVALPEGKPLLENELISDHLITIRCSNQVLTIIVPLLEQVGKHGATVDIS